MVTIQGDCCDAVVEEKMIKRIICSAAAFGLVACAQNPVAPVAERPSSVDREEVVAKMAANRWDLMIQGKIDEVYQDYVSPATKALLSRDAYRGGIRPGLWKSAKVSKVTCASEEVCSVDVIVRYAYKGKGGVAIENDAVVPETWRLLDGRWWFVPRQ